MPDWNIAFSEDPCRQHELQIQPFCIKTTNSDPHFLTAIPSGKWFIVTYVNTSSTSNVFLSTEASGGAKCVTNRANPNMNSGTPFEPGESLYVVGNDTDAYVSISGYFVGM